MKDERKELTNGYRWWRHILYLPIFAFFAGIVNNDKGLVWYVVGFILTLGLYFLLRRARKIWFDDQNLYLIYGSTERAIHYSLIESIKKSRAKVNGARYWIITYDDGTGKKRKLRYFPWDFGGVSKELNKAVRIVNPKVVIWDHPFFHE